MNPVDLLGYFLIFPDTLICFSLKRKLALCEGLHPLLCHPVAKLRHLAAEAFVVFLPDSDTSGPLYGMPIGPLRLLGTSASVTGVDSTHGFANACSGQLHVLDAWLRMAPTQATAKERAR